MTKEGLRNALTHLRLEIKEAAQLLGVSERTVRRWWDGEDIPGPAQAAIKAWINLANRNLPWRPDEISIFNDDQKQIELMRNHANEISSILNRVDSRNGPENPWKVDIKKKMANFGPFSVSFYLLANGGFSLAGYSRKDMNPDVKRDQNHIEDAVYWIAQSIDKIHMARQSLTEIANYIRKNSSTFVKNKQRRSVYEDTQQSKNIEQVAVRIDVLSDAIAEGNINYQEFEEELNQLHTLGFFPPIELISKVMNAFIRI